MFAAATESSVLPVLLMTEMFALKSDAGSLLPGPPRSITQATGADGPVPPLTPTIGFADTAIDAMRTFDTAEIPVVVADGSLIVTVVPLTIPVIEPGTTVTVTATL